MKINIGADLTAESQFFDEQGIDEFKIRTFLDDYMIKNPNQIKSYAFSVQPVVFKDCKIRLKTMGGEFPKKKVTIIGIDDKFLETTFSDLYVPTEYDEEINT